MPRIRQGFTFEQKGIGEILSRDRLKVPLNQRDYAWKDEHVRDLLTDLSGAINDDKSHFMGTIVLTHHSDNVPRVTDGQQRLATSTILLAAIRDWFYWNNEPEQAQSIEDDFLWKFARTEGVRVPRLQLNVDDNQFFSARILPRPDAPERRAAHADKPQRDSHKLMLQAATMAADHVRTVVANLSGPMPTRALLKWVDFINSEMQVIVLSVPGELDAFLMFETLNDRGLKASQADLLKNYLLGEAQEDRMHEAQQKWAQMTGVLQSLGLGQDDITVTYLHHLLITKHGQIRSAEIFDRVKKTINGPSRALRFLSEAADAANDYAALYNPSLPKWNAYAPATRQHIATINRYLQVQQIRPLMFAVARHFSAKEAHKAFELFVYWSVRFLIYGGRGGLLDRNYSIAAQRIGSESLMPGEERIRTAKGLTDALIGIIPTDAEFEDAFSKARVSSSPQARYYLRALEKKVKNDPEAEWVPSDEETTINLEHILPENPQSYWPDIAEETAKAYYRRLGNMVLLQASKNSTIGNGPFSDKKAVLSASEFRLTNMVAKYDKWGTDEIEERQRVLAQWAVETWPIKLR